MERVTLDFMEKREELYASVCENKNPPSPLYQWGTENFPLDKGGLRGV
ncbi:MAG: hypothetical protein LBC61_03955 [Candidatus Peribacteria bacterium]|nr:hypothetical protein [Candidatus Peribacteria bacterium]